MAIGSIYRVGIEWDSAYGTGPFVNVMHFRQVAVAAPPSPWETLAGDVRGQIVPLLAACASVAVGQERIKVRGVTVPTEGGDFAYLPAILGAITGEMYAPQCAPVINWRTGFIGRSYRGRTFLPPTGESAVNSGGGLSASLLANIATLGALLDGDWTGPSGSIWRLVVYSPTLSQATDVTGVQIRSQIATLRRRGL